MINHRVRLLANLLKMKHNSASSTPKSAKLGFVVVVILTIIAVALTCTTYAALTTNRRVDASGSVSATANLGIYSDSTCQTPLTSIEWGAPTPGTSITRIIYIKNTGIGASLSLSLTTSNWDPAIADGPITVSFDKTGTRLSPGQSTAASMTLTISPTTVDIINFSLAITITGNQ
ncbi:MAG TPA: hypothetical protein DGG95_09140, partial [Cytophagales bacterium]|nr:hypothetical protein [Cytophagales bacterium]